MLSPLQEVCKNLMSTGPSTWGPSCAAATHEECHSVHTKCVPHLLEAGDACGVAVHLQT